MGIAFNGSTSKLVLTGISPIVTAYPFSLLVWIKPTSGATSQGILMHGDGSNTQYARSIVAGSANAVRGAVSGFPTDSVASINTSAWKLAIYSCTSATSRVQYYSSTAGAIADTVNGTPTFASFDRVEIGMLPGDLFPFTGDIAECHIYSAALSTTDFANLAADSVKPESVTGWVDGWKLETATDLTSIGGTRTLTATAATTSATHPVNRSAADLSGSVTLDAVAPAGTFASSSSDLGGNVTLDAVAPAGTLGVAPGTVTVPALKNWSGSLQTSVTIPVVTVLSMTTGAQVLALTDQATHATTADLEITDAALAAGTTYMVAGWSADGSSRFAVPITAA